ncbi:Sel1-like protein [Neofusicoccum parvum]|uniref:Sel1-like protein n=1 Tax=Neofusicoccum parvum TaxID=310453 RepID=A0ACB5RPN2_9PEZI|nr:Sel1-like protein [Neofusicoccum parvum]
MGYQDAVQVDRAPLPTSQGASQPYPSPPSPASPRRKPINGHQSHPSITLQGPARDGARADAPTSAPDNRASVQSRVSVVSNGSRDIETPEPDRYRDSVASMAVRGHVPYRQAHISVMSNSPPASVAGDVLSDDFKRHTIASDMRYEDVQEEEEQQYERPQYFHEPYQDLTQSALRTLVGSDASLLDTQKTVEMYMANVKKTPELSVQYEFAVFLVQAAKEFIHSEDPAKKAYAETVMVKEARQILGRLADRSYPFAQYLLADGYYSGFFNKGKPDQEKAFPLFVAASKHGHAESGYRAGLMYEHGWGCRKDLAKAAQFYRASASKNHPGAASRLGHACIFGELGLGRRDRPLLLAKLHENGHGDDCFKDEVYAAQLYTQAAELGNAEACLKMGECYEHGLLGCPKDPALSVHFYTGAAMQDIPQAMMNLCAWYLIGAPPVLEKDENESYEWAKRAAEMGKSAILSFVFRTVDDVNSVIIGFTKAEYAVGYFTEMGIGCRRDPLEANVWYVRAADKGEPRAKQRLAIIRAAASGETGAVQSEGKKKGKDDKDCVVM